MRKWLAFGFGLVVLGAIAAAAFFFLPAGLEPVTASAVQPTGAALIARGEYLTKAADCEACHTTPGGQPFAGGRAFKLPYGTVYAPNITPDREHGIGAWSDAEFVRALHHGIDREGKDLFPVFPYASYALLSDDDVLAIRAYLATVKPVAANSPVDDLQFPFSQSYLMRGWRLLFVPKHPFQPDSSKDPTWNRGAYLVEALGHCGECHTPRNLLQGLDNGKKFAGGEEVGWFAYNLTNDPDHGLGGWRDAQLAQYLSTGHADGRGPASGPMAEAVGYSLRFLTGNDINAMVAYLRTIPAQQDGPLAVGRGASTAAEKNPLGAHIFVEACAGCHLPDGRGRQSPWAALKGSHTTADPSANNLLRVLAEGTQIRTAQGLMFMHPFTSAYTDEEIAALANYVCAQFGQTACNVTADQVSKTRKDVPPKTLEASQ
jgi:mono/diheme cytochrome c family protein